MPKPANLDRPTHLKFAIPESLRTRLDLRLYSEVEGRVPHGAYSDYLCSLIREDLDKQPQEIQGG